MKKKVFFKFNGFIVLVLLSLCMASCKIGSDPFGTVESGDFIYATKGFLDKDEGVSIIGLSEQGKQKEVLIFPNMIDGHPVVRFGAQFVLKGSGPIIIDNAKKVYFCNLFKDNQYIKTNFKYSAETLEIFFGGSGTEHEKTFGEFLCRSSAIYVDNYLFQNFYDFYDYHDLRVATIAYYYEEELSYFVDYVLNEKVSIIPPEPYKEGYTFDGWYKDLEFTDKWDFDNDIVVPIPKEKEFEGDFDYEPVKLYAKWKEK